MYILKIIYIFFGNYPGKRCPQEGVIQGILSFFLVCLGDIGLALVFVKIRLGYLVLGIKILLTQELLFRLQGLGLGLVNFRFKVAWLYASQDFPFLDMLSFFNR